MKSDAGIEGVGFSIIGARHTDMWTHSTEDEYILFDKSGAHVLYDLLKRGLQFEESTIEQFMQAWAGNKTEGGKRIRTGGIWDTYIEIRENSPPEVPA